jgi:hypothetical protein
MATRRLSEIAKTIRSKNAGVDKITFEVIFADRADYDLVCRKTRAVAPGGVPDLRYPGEPDQRLG